MIKYKNQCVDCGFPCMGDLCINRNVPYTYCDICGTEKSHLFDVSGEDVCQECLESIFDFRTAGPDGDELVCENCGEFVSRLYDADGVEICGGCLDSYFPEIEID